MLCWDRSGRDGAAWMGAPAIDSPGLGCYFKNFYVSWKGPAGAPHHTTSHATHIHALMGFMARRIGSSSRAAARRQVPGAHPPPRCERGITVG